jgi:hypothetical protein
MNIDKINTKADRLEAVNGLVRALSVLVKDPNIFKFLSHNDPMALKQATTALSNYTESFIKN